MLSTAPQRVGAAVPLPVTGATGISRTRRLARCVRAAVWLGGRLLRSRPRHWQRRCSRNEPVHVPPATKQSVTRSVAASARAYLEKAWLGSAAWNDTSQNEKYVVLSASIHSELYWMLPRCVTMMWDASSSCHAHLQPTCGSPPEEGGCLGV